MIAKGKGNRSANRGRPKRKLTEPQELELVTKYNTGSYTLKQLADIYEIHFVTVSRIIKRSIKRLKDGKCDE